MGFLEKGGFSRRHHQVLDGDEEPCYDTLYIVSIILGWKGKAKGWSGVTGLCRAMGPSRSKGDHSVYGRENPGQMGHKVMYTI